MVDFSAFRAVMYLLILHKAQPLFLHLTTSYIYVTYLGPEHISDSWFKAINFLLLNKALGDPIALVYSPFCYFLKNL